MINEDINGYWRCLTCREFKDVSDPRWRWNGSSWEHHHGYPIGYVEAKLIDPVKTILELEAKVSKLEVEFLAVVKNFLRDECVYECTHEDHNSDLLYYCDMGDYNIQCQNSEHFELNVIDLEKHKYCSMCGKPIRIVKKVT
jgi:hypothetical protein